MTMEMYRVCIFTRVVFFPLLFFLRLAKKWYRISENSVWISPYTYIKWGAFIVYFFLSFLQMMRYTWQLGICAPVCSGILTHFCYRYSVSFSFLFDFVTLWRMTVLVAHSHTHSVWFTFLREMHLHFFYFNCFYVCSPVLSVAFRLKCVIFFSYSLEITFHCFFSFSSIKWIKSNEKKQQKN